MEEDLRQVMKSSLDMEVRGMGREHGKRECHFTTLDQSPPFYSAIFTYFHRLGYVEPGPDAFLSKM